MRSVGTESEPVVDSGSKRPAWRAYFKALGPGLVTGASDDDPSGIATYAQAGARFQYGLLWASLLTLPLMGAVQEICDRTALATGRTLGYLAIGKFPRWRVGLWVLLGALVVANLLNVTADIVAVGEGMHLLHAGPAPLWAVLAGIVVTVLIVAGSFAMIARIFKVLCVALLSYVVVMFGANASWPSVLSHTLVPHIELDKEYMLLLVAVLGTTISPYLFFWQSAHRIEDLRREDEGGDDPLPLGQRSSRAARHKQSTSRSDVFVGMAFSNLVMFAIIVATGATLGQHGHTTITSAAQAAEALRPVAGGMSSTLFALGFIGSGMLAIPVLAGSGAVGVAGLLHKDWGFSRSARQAPLFYGIVVAGTLGGTLLTLFGVDPIQLLVYSALINGLLATPFLILAMLISSDHETMGDYANGRAARVLGWTTTALMAAAAIAYLAFTFG